MTVALPGTSNASAMFRVGPANAEGPFQALVAAVAALLNISIVRNKASETLLPDFMNATGPYGSAKTYELCPSRSYCNFQNYYDFEDWSHQRELNSRPPHYQ